MTTRAISLAELLLSWEVIVPHLSIAYTIVTLTQASSIAKPINSKTWGIAIIQKRERVFEVLNSHKESHSLVNIVFTVLSVSLVLVSVHPVQTGCEKCSFVAMASSDSSSIAVHFIDVGEGDSILIVTPQQDVLIDGGPVQAGAEVVDYLTGLNITHLNLMVATHPHEDHIGGLIAVLNSVIAVDEILLNNQSYSTSSYSVFMNLAQNHTRIVAQRNQIFVLSQFANLTVFNPVQPLEFDETNDYSEFLNDNSIVIKLQAGNASFLLTGDAGAKAEQSMTAAGLKLQSNVLKVGHHGSAYSTTQPFLNAVSPTYAVISVGDNPYGHPAQETVDRLLANNVIVYSTGHSGTITALTDEVPVTFQDNPQPIPELAPIAIFSTLTIATLIVVAMRKRRQN
jgi:competence protein ComEC